MFVRGSVFIICTIVILFYYSPILAGVTLGGIIPVVIFGGFYGMQMKKLTKQI
jgi:ABC-type bacteriocin/lantibiotic exporter with double-glycine peptidase domain